MPDLIATLGSNPLPVVVSALYHRPTLLHIVTTSQVESLAERVWQLLESKGVKRGLRVVLPDAAATDIDALVATLDASAGRAPRVPWDVCGLDYTGGTKLMSAEIRAWWRSRNPNGISSYLSHEGKLVYGLPPGADHVKCASAQTALTFKELADLHFTYPLTCGDEHRDEVRAEWARRILAHVCDPAKGFTSWKSLLPPFRPEVLEVKYQGADGSEKADNHGDDDKNKITYWGANAIDGKDNLGDGAPLLRHDCAEALNTLGISGSKLDDVVSEMQEGKKPNKDRRKETLTWLEGDWLEVAFARLLEDSKLFDEVHQDVKRKGSASTGDNFQADVVAVKGYRAYLFSCTTMSRSSECKHKLFEAAHRASRIGGEYARAALVSLMSAPHQAVQTLREDGWEGYDLYRAFGLPHLRGERASTSVDPNGREGPPETLVESLEKWIAA